jgi:hypothetical protein
MLDFPYMHLPGGITRPIIAGGIEGQAEEGHGRRTCWRY